MKGISAFALSVMLLFVLYVSAQKSPYAMFGDTTPTLSSRKMACAEDSALACAVILKDNTIAYLKFDFKESYVRMTDAKGMIIRETVISSADIARFTAPDSKAELYPSVSPYTYCMGTPTYYVDPTGMYIEKGSQSQWEQVKLTVAQECDRLSQQISDIRAKAANKGWSESKLTQKLGDRVSRRESLNGSLAAMGVLEQSTQGYSLSKIGINSIGSVLYNPQSGFIGINYNSAANFVHEMTHAWQFEVGAIVFGLKNGLPRLQDVSDEVAAYKAQYAYSPYSVAGLVPAQYLNSADEITPSWLAKIVYNGDAIYSNEANYGKFGVGIYSTPAQINAAFPKAHLPASYNPFYDPHILIKR